MVYTTELYSFTVLEAEHLRLECYDGPVLCVGGGGHFLALIWLAFVSSYDRGIECLFLYFPNVFNCGKSHII